MNSVILFALLCTGAYASTMPVLDFLKWCPVIECPDIRCPDGLLKRSFLPFPNGKLCPACQNTCVRNPMLIKKSAILPWFPCPVVDCAQPTCDRSHWLTTTVSIGGRPCSGCPVCTQLLI